MFRCSLVSIAAITLISVAPIAYAQYTFFPNDATINYAINTYSNYVGYANISDITATPRKNPTSPTINFVTGGSIGGFLDAYNSSTVNVSGGSIGSIGSDLHAYDSSTVNVSGGSISGDLWVNGAAVLNIFGRGLVAPFVYPGGSHSVYSLSGTLLDGTIVTNKYLYIQNGSSARFTLNNVPAPGSLVTALIGVVPGVLMLRRRRKSTQK